MNFLIGLKEVAVLKKTNTNMEGTVQFSIIFQKMIKKMKTNFDGHNVHQQKSKLFNVQIYFF